MFYTNPLLTPPFGRGAGRTGRRTDRSGWREAEQPGGGAERDSVGGAGGGSLSSAGWEAGGPAGRDRECPLCLAELGPDQFPALRNCPHPTCLHCLQLYVRIEIQEGRVNLKCPQCNEILHPNGTACCKANYNYC